MAPKVVSRRNAQMIIRNVLIETLSCLHHVCEPGQMVPLDALTLAARIKCRHTPDFCNLLQELQEEGVLSVIHDKIGPGPSFQGIPFEEILEKNEPETQQHKILRRLTGRLRRVLDRNNQLHLDLMWMSQFVHSRQNNITVSDILERLPFEWKYDKRRCQRPYVARCLFELCKRRLIYRDERNENFHALPLVPSTHQQANQEKQANTQEDPKDNVSHMDM